MLVNDARRLHVQSPLLLPTWLRPHAYPGGKSQAGLGQRKTATWDDMRIFLSCGATAMAYIYIYI
jgi:hypothetical protein